MTDKEKVIKELKETLDSLDITNEHRLNLIRAIEYLQEVPLSDKTEKAINKLSTNVANGLMEQLKENLQEEPIFKIGDTIQKKDNNSIRYSIINKTSDGYRALRGLSDTIVIWFSEQDQWELVEEPISKELEEAAEEWDESLYRSDAFKAGAKWQKQQIAKENMLLPFKEYDNLMDSIEKKKKEGYLKGFEVGKNDAYKDFFKNYIECDVRFDGLDLYTTETWGDMDELLHKINAKEGDKVKLIIIKEE